MSVTIGYRVLFVNAIMSTYNSRASMIGPSKALWITLVTALFIYFCVIVHLRFIAALDIGQMLRSYHIFEKIKGFEGRCNTILYKNPKCPPTQKFLVFFGGDMQDLRCNMERNRDSNAYSEWCLENTAEILFNQFPKHHILIIQPTRMSIVQGIAFSCFDNFVPGDKYGVPSFCKTHNAVKHLQKLMGSVCSRIVTVEQKERINYDLNHVNYTLMGFSKGCVVLNQLLHEISTMEANPESEEYSFLHKVKDIWWLDGGHSGFKDTWITDAQILETFAKLDIQVQIHITPYQISDTRRPWICQEEKYFYSILKGIGVSVHRQIHFTDHPPNLLYHFKLLKNISDPTQESICTP